MLYNPILKKLPQNHVNYKNYQSRFKESDQIFKGKINYPIYYGGIKPELKNHVGAPEAFYSGQIGLTIGGGINFNKQSEIFSFTESVKMKKISDSLEELSYEKNIKNNFSQSLQNKLILKLNNFR